MFPLGLLQVSKERRHWMGQGRIAFQPALFGGVFLEWVSLFCGFKGKPTRRDFSWCLFLVLFKGTPTRTLKRGSHQGE